MTVNFEEIEKFTSIANEWWNENGKFKLLHDINPVRLEYIIGKIKKYFNKVENIKILDIGCGGGLISIPFANLGADVTAIDAGAENISIAKAKALEKNLNINFLNCNSSELLSHNKKYDVIICLEVVEHVDDQDELIEDISKLMSEKSIAILSTINKNLKSKLLAKYLAENILKWVPKNTHDFNKFLSPANLRKICLKNSLKLEDLKGISYSIFDNDWKISNDIDLNYISLITKHI